MPQLQNEEILELDRKTPSRSMRIISLAISVVVVVYFTVSVSVCVTWSLRKYLLPRSLSHPDLPITQNEKLNWLVHNRKDYDRSMPTSSVLLNDPEQHRDAAG